MNDDALGWMRQARGVLVIERESGANSRGLAIALTELETAILWRQQDLAVKGRGPDGDNRGSADDGG